MMGAYARLPGLPRGAFRSTPIEVVDVERMKKADEERFIDTLGRIPRNRLGISLLVFLGYFAAAFVAKNFYPFSMFDMYAGKGRPSASRIVARDAAGHLHPVSHYSGWECPHPIDDDPTKCQASPFYYIPYVDESAVRYVRGHKGAGDSGQPVDLVFHVWRLGRRGVESEENCLIQHCRAVR